MNEHLLRMNLFKIQRPKCLIHNIVLIKGVQTIRLINTYSAKIKLGTPNMRLISKKSQKSRIMGKLKVTSTIKKIL